MEERLQKIIVLMESISGINSKISGSEKKRSTAK